MGVYFFGWVRSGKGVLSAHSVGVGGPLGWVPSAKGVQSAHTKGVRGGGRGVLALWSVTMAHFAIDGYCGTCKFVDKFQHL